MEKFNLEEYLKNPSRKVVTRDGKNVRILCTDRKLDSKEVVGLTMNNDGTEGLLSWSKQGKSLSLNNSSFDLYFAPEKHEGWVNLYKWLGKEYTYHMGNVYNSKAEAKNGSSNNNYKYIATIRIEWEE